MMIISLHLGAHKTATTYIQKALEQSREALRASGVGFLPLKEIRSAITSRIGLPGFGLPAAVASVLEDHGDCERLILSDENILGGLVPPALSRQFYARRKWRVKRLLRNLRGHEVQIFFATRTYDDFVAAMYSEYIHHKPFLDAPSFLRRVQLDALSWPKVIATFVDLVGANNVVTWRYEDFQSIEHEVFDRLTGGFARSIEKPRDRFRESLSAEAVQALTALQGSLNPAQIRTRVKSVAAALPKGPENPRFRPLDRAASEQLRQRYDVDIAQLPAGVRTIAAPAGRVQAG